MVTALTDRRQKPGGKNNFPRKFNLMGNYLTSPPIWYASPDRVCGYAHKHKRTTQSLRVSHEDALAAPSVKPVHLKRAVVRCHASPRFKWFGSFPWTTLCTNNPCLTPQLRAKVWLLPSFLTPGREQTQLLYISLSDLLMGSNHQTPVSFGGFWNPFTEHSPNRGQWQAQRQREHLLAGFCSSPNFVGVFLQEISPWSPTRFCFASTAHPN